MKVRYILLLVLLGFIISSVFYFTECKQEKPKVASYKVELINNEYTMENNTISFSYGGKVDIDLDDFKVTEIYSDGTTKVVQQSGNNDGFKFESTIPNDEITPAGNYALIFTHIKLNKSIEIKIIVNKTSFNMGAVSWDYISPFTYDGTEKEVKITNLPVGVSVSYVGNIATNAGSFIATAIFTHNEANYEAIPNKTIEWKIEKSTLQVSAKPHSIIYGDNLSNNGVTYSGFEGTDDISNLGGTLDFDYTYTKGDDAGIYALTPKGLSSLNYNIEYVSGVLTVNKKDLTLKVNDVTIPYNTDVVDCGISSDDFVNGDTILDLGEYTIDFGGYVKGSNVGEYDITIVGLKNNKNYNINVVDGKLTVIPIDANIDTSEIALKVNEFIYDGTSVESKLEVINLPSGVGVKDIVVKGKNAVDAGDYVAVIYLEYFDVLNYNPMAQIERTFKINKANVESLDDVALSANSLMYRGCEHVVEVENIPVGAKIKTDSLMGNKATDVGNYTVNVTFVNLNSNYTDFEINKKLNWNITPAPLQVVAKTQIITYGENIPTFDFNDVEISGYVGLDDVSSLEGTINYDTTYNIGDPAKDNVYILIPKGITDKNYNITFIPGLLNVKKAKIDFKNVEWLNISCVYSGEEIKPILNYESTEIIKITYSYFKIGGGEFAPINVGTYKANAEIEVLNNNYEIINKNINSFEYSIIPKSVDVSKLFWSKLDLIFSGSSIKPIIINTIEGVIVQDYSYTKDGYVIEPIDVGTYVAKAILNAVNDNYQLNNDFIEFSYIISPKTIDCSVASWQGEEEYVLGETIIKPVLTGLPDGASASYEYFFGNFRIDNFLSAGNYVAIAKINPINNNYVIVQYPLNLQFNFLILEPLVEKEIGVKLVVDGVEYIIYKDGSYSNLEYDSGRSVYNGKISTDHLFEGTGRVLVESIYVFEGESIEDIWSYRNIQLVEGCAESFWLTLTIGSDHPSIALAIMGYGAIILECLD